MKFPTRKPDPQHHSLSQQQKSTTLQLVVHQTFPTWTRAGPQHHPTHKKLQKKQQKLKVAEQNAGGVVTTKSKVLQYRWRPTTSLHQPQGKKCEEYKALTNSSTHEAGGGGLTQQHRHWPASSPPQCHNTLTPPNTHPSSRTPSPTSTPYTPSRLHPLPSTHKG